MLCTERKIYFQFYLSYVYKLRTLLVQWVTSVDIFLWILKTFSHLFMWSFDYIVPFVPGFYSFVWYSMSTALFQYNVMCTEPNKVTPYGTLTLEHKENGHCNSNLYNRQVAVKQEHGYLFLFPLKSTISVTFWQQRDLVIFCHHCRFFCTTFMLWLCYF